MFLSKSISYYKRADVREAMVHYAQDKEVGVRFGDSFAKRPDILSYPGDVLEFAKQRASSFHISEERWANPLQLHSDMSRRELDELRTGWDLVLDIDCAIFEYSKISAYFTVKALKHHGITCVSCKFSGNKGFHIAIPFESFPEKIGGKETRLLFPEAPRKIAEYIKFLIKDPVSNAILKLENGQFEKVVQKTGIELEKIAVIEKDELGNKVQRLNSDPFLAIDTILIASRHMYRMPYSLHEKSGLVSTPIDLDKILSFRRTDADPEKVKVEKNFLDQKNLVPGEAANLIIQAFDFSVPKNRDYDDEVEKIYKEFIETEAIPEHFFPPCIQNIQKGLKDGKKRSVFILRNFLECSGWDKDKIKEYIYSWNENNPEKLRETVIKGQLRYASAKKVPPPNCANTAYYKDFGICTPDNFCRRIKNPCQYAKFKVLLNKRHTKSRKKTIKSVKNKTKNTADQEPS